MLLRRRRRSRRPRGLPPLLPRLLLGERLLRLRLLLPLPLRLLRRRPPLPRLLLERDLLPLREPGLRLLLLPLRPRRRLCPPWPAAAVASCAAPAALGLRAAVGLLARPWLLLLLLLLLRLLPLLLLLPFLPLRGPLSRPLWGPGLAAARALVRAAAAA